MSQQDHGKSNGEWTCTTPGTVVSSSAGTALESLLSAVDYSCLSGDPAACLIQTVTVDSRKSRPGALFIALCGVEQDGHDFVGQALAANCTAVVVEKGRVSAGELNSCEACILEVEDSRKAYGTLAGTLFSSPADEMTMLAVTGTNGKTSISYLLESVLRKAGKQVGVMGTINYRYDSADGRQKTLPSPFTTPEPLLLQENLRKMADAGVDCVIMEVSSHGLEQNRIGRLLFDVAAFSNLSRDHLDYHQDMESYFQAKVLLFTEHLQTGGQAVICFPAQQSEWSERLHTICRERSIPATCCGNPRGDIFPQSVQGTLQHTEITLQTGEGEYTFTSPLAGDFNVENLQVSFAMALAAGIAPSTICAALKDATGAPGRMQRVLVSAGDQELRPAVFVDYAHTPDALAQVLTTVRQLVHGRLFCVFGCGGGRDSGKRQLMGEICGNSADVAIVTDDNPRTENPADIHRQVTEGVLKTDLPRRDMAWLRTGGGADGGFVVIPKREQAIAAAIEAAAAGDIVLIAGKGHETYQITRSGKRFFDDTLEAQKALTRWSLHSLSIASKGKCVNPEYRTGFLGAIVTDSRQVQRGDIFVALKGERFDGHDYVYDVASRGAGCLVVEREPDEPLSTPCILVEDCLQGLGDLAAYRRASMKAAASPQVVGITGSSGKTTVKEMCYAIFSRRWPDRDDRPRSRVLKTEGNFNNLIGLPLSLLPVEVSHKALILEMGMNQPGEIARLTQIADPDVACILNVHGAHLQGLGTIEGVAAAKGELFRNCNRDTMLVVNNDDPRVVALAAGCAQRKISFGLDPHGTLHHDLYVSARGGEKGEENSFVLHVEEQQARVTLHVPGEHNITNALAAAAIAHASGIALQHIAEGLSDFRAPENRMQIIDGPAGSRIINDCYNANPASMKAGIKTLSELGDAPRIAILGDMLELGPEAEELHQEIGAYVAKRGIEFLGVVGDFADSVAEGVRKSRSVDTVVWTFSSRKHCYEWLQELINDGTIQTGSYILVKASRGMHLENLVQQLRGEMS